MSNSNPYCPTHKQEMVYKEGVSKAGKPYKMYKCEAEGCEQIQWVNDKKPYKKPQPLLDDQQYQTILKALREIYKLIESKK